MGGIRAWARLGAIVALSLVCTCHGRRVEFRRSLLAPATATATTSAVSLDLAYISGNLTNITADVNTTAASVAICQIADSNSSTAVQTIAQGFAATLINGTHGNATGEALSMALANTTNTTQQNVAQGYATAILAFYAANYTKVCSTHQGSVARQISCPILAGATADSLLPTHILHSRVHCVTPTRLLFTGSCRSYWSIFGGGSDRRGRSS